MSFLRPGELRRLFPQAAYLDSRGEVYLDSAATTLKLSLIWEAMREFYEKEASNVHRGDHHLSLRATEKYEKARAETARFLGARQPEEIVFTRGATEGLNLLAHSLGASLKEGDGILVTEMEHHSNILPWRELAEKKKCRLQALPVTEDGALDMGAFETFLTAETKIFSCAHVSNVTGAVNPVEEMIQKAKSRGALTIIDAAQSAALMNLNVRQMDCDFLVFSGHKVFSPSGIGALYGRKALLDRLPPWQTGGGTIYRAAWDHVDWADSPQKFEAGTPFIEGAIAMGAALEFLRENVDFSEAFRFERELVRQAEEELLRIPGLRAIGPADNRSNMLSFVVEGFNSADISFIMAEEKAAVRAGHHCCMPLMKRLGLSSGTVRASFSLYSREEDIKALKSAAQKALNVLMAA